jgi:hypothetical protein
VQCLYLALSVAGNTSDVWCILARQVVLAADCRDRVRPQLSALEPACESGVRLLGCYNALIGTVEQQLLAEVPTRRQGVHAVSFQALQSQLLSICWTAHLKVLL